MCGQGDSVEGNEILYCDGKGCHVAIHQLCYGVERVPEGDWHCDGCAAKLKPSTSHCCLCPVIGGKAAAAS